MVEALRSDNPLLQEYLPDLERKGKEMGRVMAGNITGMGTPGSPYTNVSGPTPTTKEDVERLKLESIPKDVFTKILEHPITKGTAGAMSAIGLPFNMASDVVRAGLKPAGEWLGRQTGYDILGTRLPYTGAPLWEQVKETYGPGLKSVLGTMFPRYEGGETPTIRPTVRPTRALSTTPPVDMTRTGTSDTGAPIYEAAPSSMYRIGEGPWKGLPEWDQPITGGGSFSVLPGLNEGALARAEFDRDIAKMKADLAPKSYYDVHPEERIADQIAAENAPIINQMKDLIQKNISMMQGFGLSTNPLIAEGQRLSAMKRLEGLGKEFLDFQGKQGGVRTALSKTFLENAPGSPESDLKTAQAGYYRAKTSMEEMGFPSEVAERVARASYYNRPQVFQGYGPEGTHRTMAFNPKTGKFDVVTEGALPRETKTFEQELAIAAIPHLIKSALGEEPLPTDKEGIARREKTIESLFSRFLGGNKEKTTAGIPTKDEFIKTTKAKGSKLSDAQLSQYYDEKYGRQ